MPTVEESMGSYGKLAELVLFLSMGLVVDPVKVLVFLPGSCCWRC